MDYAKADCREHPQSRHQQLSRYVHQHTKPRARLADRVSGRRPHSPSRQNPSAKQSVNGIQLANQRQAPESVGQSPDTRSASATRPQARNAKPVPALHGKGSEHRHAANHYLQSTRIVENINPILRAYFKTAPTTNFSHRALLLKASAKKLD